jgi:hypothetical protein
MIGFLDGMDLGNIFSVTKLVGDPCYVKANKSYDEYETKYLDNVTTGQLVDGLDEFFKDYRNRKILISNGVWIVLRSISGMPQDELEKMIESYRRNAK